MEPSPNIKKSFFSEWLEKLQQESWQLELLISGLALFGIWESQNVLQRFEFYLDVNAVSEVRSALNLFKNLLWAGWGIFLTNLLIHIIIRGFWIGAIGLRYVSGDIDFDQLNYSKKFTDYYKSRIGSFDNYIEKLEKISSVLFSFTFLLFFMFLSFVVFNLFFVILMAILSRLVDDTTQAFQMYAGAIGILYYGLGMLVFIDFFTLGAFKKIKDNTVSTIYIWIYRFFSTVSLSFLYRPLLLNFIDNSYTRKLFFLAIPYGLVLFTLNGLYMERYPYFPSFSARADYHDEISALSINWLYYDDLRSEHHNTFRKDGDVIQKSKINYVSLNQYEHDKNELKLFLEYHEKDGDYIKRSDDKNSIDPFRKDGVRHGVFFKNKVEDKGLKDLEQMELKELGAMRKIIRNEEYPDDTPESWINQYSQYQEEDIRTLREEIKTDYSSQRTAYMEIKLAQLKKELLKLYTIKIDNELIKTDELESSYYIHPNMHEKGILCYVPLDSLDRGPHMFHISKRNHELDCTDDCYTRSLNVPFRVVR